MSRFGPATLRLPYGLSSISMLAAAERVARVPLRDCHAQIDAIESRLAELRAIEQRAQALTTIAPLPFSVV